MTEHDHDLLPDDQPALPAGEHLQPKAETAAVARDPATIGTAGVARKVDEAAPPAPISPIPIAAKPAAAAAPAITPIATPTPPPSASAANGPPRRPFVPRPNPRAPESPSHLRSSPSGAEPPADLLASFLSWPLGASLIYLVSAACILLGAALVLAPDSADELRLSERLGMVATLFTYQAAIAGVCLLVCRWRRGHPDAVALSVLVTLFLAAAPAGLDTVALQRPWDALGSGLVAVGMAVLIAWRWQSGVGGRLPAGLGAALGLAVIAADLGPGFLGLMWHNDLDRLRQSWLVLWSLVLASGVILAMAAMRASIPINDHQLPLSQRSGFRWTLGLMLAALFGLHQWLLAYACGLELGWGDFLPYALILTVVGGELKKRLLGSADNLGWVYAALIPPVTLGMDPQVSQLGWDAGGYQYSLMPGFMALFSLAIAGQAWRWHSLPVAVVAVVWGAGAIATWGIGIDSQTLNLASSVGFLALGWTVLGVRSKHPILLMVTPLGAALSILYIPPVQVWMWDHAVDPRAIYGLILGCGWLAAHAAFPRVLPALAGFMGGTALALGAMGACFVPDSVLTAPLAAALAVAAICATQAWWTRSSAALYPGMVPIAVGVLWLLAHHRAWVLVPVAFALLALGARWSRRTALAT